MSAWRTSLRVLLLALCGAAAGLFAGAPEVRAEGTKSPIFAIIDVQKVLRDSTAIKGLNQEIEKRRDEYQEELRKKEEELRTADQELTRQRTILGPEVFAQKRQELERKVGMLQREVQERKRALDQSFANGLSQVQAELAVVAKDIAEAKGLDLILSKATVVIVKPEFEVTDEASELLNERLPVVTVAFPDR
jgi:outer membrane protein